ncbi:MAG: acyl-CoA thioesterase [Phycisphaerales bacterium]|nr:acyl-CoA thioesterase [Phycisphaerae bacterium]NNF44407.1 acyl-CoA thioesterase [Phycisphaerales bacterium]NNM25815.1 acyl-CoA thioesterase [Phycisphaerales bacterium]
MNAPAPDTYHPALRVVMMPRDTNAYGTIFGGVILSYVDQAGFIEARKYGHHRWVTASIERVDFQAPVMVGDVVDFLTRTCSTGTTSVRVAVRVEAERYTTGDVVPVTTAEMTMVAVNAAAKPIPFDSPPSVGPSGLGASRS